MLPFFPSQGHFVLFSSSPFNFLSFSLWVSVSMCSSEHDCQNPTLIFFFFYYCFPPFTQCYESAAGPPLHQLRETRCLRQSEPDRQTEQWRRQWETVMIMMCVSMGGLTPLTTCQQRQPRYYRREAGRTLLFSGCFMGSLSASYEDKADRNTCMYLNSKQAVLRRTHTNKCAWVRG